MVKSICAFTKAPQATAFAQTFGDRDLDDLPMVDQTALVVVLAHIVYERVAHCPARAMLDIAVDAIPEDMDYTSPAMQEALDLLDGISVEDAAQMIAFLSQ